MRLSLIGGLLGLAIFAPGCEIKPDIDKPIETISTPEPKAPSFEARPAEVGVGIQGQSLKNETGIGKAIAQPAVILFKVKEKIPFEVLIPSAMNVFKASEGRAPDSHQEFMSKIIKANQIQLPKLPEGQEYQYRPEDEQLWVQPIK